MEGRKKFKKDLDADAEDSSASSSSSSSMYVANISTCTQNQADCDKVQKTVKSINLWDLKNTPSEVEVKAGQGSEVNEEISKMSMSDLPPEMLVEILKCVDNLLACRLVNLQWREISTGLLSTKLGCQVEFLFENGNFFADKLNDQDEADDEQQGSLKDFLQCMRNSENCPCSRFMFLINLVESEPSAFFEHPDWIQFFSDFEQTERAEIKSETKSGAKIKSLGLNFKNVDHVDSFRILAEKLGDLLLNKTPHLEEFNLNFKLEGQVEAPQVGLFPTPKDAEDAEQNPAQFQFRLGNLKQIEIPSSLFSDHTEFALDLLNAAVNLKKIHLSHGEVLTKDVFRILFSLGKLDLLKTAIIDIDEDFLSFIRSEEYSKCDIPLLFKLQVFYLPIYFDQGQTAFLTQATNFLSGLFESSKNTLRELSIHPLGNFQRLEFPVLRNLKKLELYTDESKIDTYRDPYFPPGVRSRDIFPNVDHLELNLDYYDLLSSFPQLDSIPRLASVRTIDTINCQWTEYSISKLALLCPNLKNLHIIRDKDDDAISDSWTVPDVKFLTVGRQIWTHMKQLETLEVPINVDLPWHFPLALDSCLTGISLNSVRRLYEMTAAKKILEKWGSQASVSESELMVEREHPSILDMKALKTLIINPYSNGKIVSREDFLTKKLTWISQEYAFQFMPHLKPKPNPNLLWLQEILQ